MKSIACKMCIINCLIDRCVHVYVHTYMGVCLSMRAHEGMPEQRGKKRPLKIFSEVISLKML